MTETRVFIGKMHHFADAQRMVHFYIRDLPLEEKYKPVVQILALQAAQPGTGAGTKFHTSGSGIKV